MVRGRCFRKVDVSTAEQGDEMPTLAIRHALGDSKVIEGAPAAEGPAPAEGVFEARDVAVSYSGVLAVESLTLDVQARRITALIGPSGGGESTFLRTFNRMNDLIPGAYVSGHLAFHGRDLYGPDVDPIEVRRRIGMVFQKPNPFPKSIYDNVAFGPRINGRRKGLDDVVERALRHAVLWVEVKGKLGRSAFTLSW